MTAAWIHWTSQTQHDVRRRWHVTRTKTQAWTAHRNVTLAFVFCRTWTIHKLSLTSWVEERSDHYWGAWVLFQKGGSTNSPRHPRLYIYIYIFMYYTCIYIKYFKENLFAKLNTKMKMKLEDEEDTVSAGDSSIHLFSTLASSCAQGCRVCWTPSQPVHC